MIVRSSRNSMIFSLLYCSRVFLKSFTIYLRARHARIGSNPARHSGFLGQYMESSTGEVTRLLRDWSNGNREALDKLLPAVYDELRRLAHHYLAHERPDHTLQTTALVHEAYLKLIDQRSVNWENRAQFFALSAQAMRRILVDSARRHTSIKRGSGGVKVSLDEAATVSGREANESLLALDLALQELEKIDADQSRIVELRYFGGLTIEETAEVMKTSPATVKREWTMARAWLYHAINGSSGVMADPTE
jgi:RNA polymerase sigma factor (TIGR02999 family)